jgi:hypothetical protein
MLSSDEKILDPLNADDNEEFSEIISNNNASSTLITTNNGTNEVDKIVCFEKRFKMKILRILQMMIISEAKSYLCLSTFPMLFQNVIRLD